LTPSSITLPKAHVNNITQVIPPKRETLSKWCCNLQVMVGKGSSMPTDAI